MFTSPILPYETTVAFSLRVMSNDGIVSSNSAVLYVMVNHYAGGYQQQQPLLEQQQQLPMQRLPSQQQNQPSPNSQQYPNPYSIITP